MSYKIVVARYNENIDWLNDETDNCIIYNKGDKLGLDNEILLDNLGRESETYLNYIIQNYNSLPDVVVFTQARINDHRVSGDDVQFLIDLKNTALINDKSEPSLIHYETYTYNCWDYNWNSINGWYYLSDNYKNNEHITFIDWFQQYIHIKYPNPIKIYTNGIFAVSKKLILKNSLEYYKQLILQVNHHINSTEGHFFERSWYYIFN